MGKKKAKKEKLQKYQPHRKIKIASADDWGYLDLIAPDKMLDLHNCTFLEAEEKINSFLGQCLLENNHKVEIITGAGIHSPEGVAILKPLAKKIIAEHNLTYKENYSGSSLLIKLTKE